MQNLCEEENMRANFSCKLPLVFSYFHSLMRAVAFLSAYLWALCVLVLLDIPVLQALSVQAEICVSLGHQSALPAIQQNRNYRWQHKEAQVGPALTKRGEIVCWMS